MCKNNLFISKLVISERFKQIFNLYTFLKMSNDDEQKQKQQNKRSKSKFTSDDDNHMSEVRIIYI